jgi:hypothetical protein
MHGKLDFYRGESTKFEISAVVRNKDGVPIGRKVLGSDHASDISDFFDRLNAVKRKRRKKKLPNVKGKHKKERLPSAVEANNILAELYDNSETEESGNGDTE